LAKVPKPKPKPRPKIKIVKKDGEQKQPVKPGQEKASTDSKEFIPLNTDQQAIAMSKGFAERADNGDIIHTVRYLDESLVAISKWYTGKNDNIEKIQKANNLEPSQSLKPGDRIRIPLNIASNLRRMSSDFFVER